jgi:hypothetical protein
VYEKERIDLVPGNDVAFGITLVANGYAAVKFHPVVLPTASVNLVSPGVCAG